MTEQTPEQIAARIRHEPEAGRFVVDVDGVEAKIEYEREDGRVTILHTGVPPAIGGRGIAGALVRTLLDWARGAGLKVHAACSYANAWIARHPEYEDLRG
jgi:predicted GNAT family acetyltransferase